MDQEAFRIYVSKTVPRTVFVIRMGDVFVAVRSDGTEVARNQFSARLMTEVRALAADPINNIWAIAQVTAPKERKPGRFRPRRRNII